MNALHIIFVNSPNIKRESDLGDASGTRPYDHHRVSLLAQFLKEHVYCANVNGPTISMKDCSTVYVVSH
jgi:hypothetical protein